MPGSARRVLRDGGTISPASAGGPPSDATATPANARVPIGRSAVNDCAPDEAPMPDEPLHDELSSLSEAS